LSLPISHATRRPEAGTKWRRNLLQSHEIGLNIEASLESCGRPFVGAQRNRFRFDVGLAERIPVECVDSVTARVGDRRPSWKRLRKVLEYRLRLELRRRHSSTNSVLIPS
jgi:hypothetical protein